MVNEIHPAVEAKNVQARRAAKAVEDKALLTNRQRKATVRFLFRELVLLVILALVWTALNADLIVWQIAWGLTCLLMACLGIQFGAWWQFMTGKEV
jgi:hypothetical protein